MLHIQNFNQCTCIYSKAFPLVQQSDHWKVTIGESPEKNRARKGVFNVYRFSVNNTGGWAYNVQVYGFRDEPKTQTNYGLFTMDYEKVGRNAMSFEGYPVSVKANEVKVYITWQEHPVSNMPDKKTGKLVSNRKYMQEFTFKEK